MGYHSDLAIDQRLVKTQPQELSGAAERLSTHTARMLFIPAGKLAGDGTWRYFDSQAQALRAKRDYRGLTHRPTHVEYWNHREQTWWGE